MKIDYAGVFYASLKVCYRMKQQISNFVVGFDIGYLPTCELHLKVKQLPSIAVVGARNILKN